MTGTPPAPADEPINSLWAPTIVGVALIAAIGTFLFLMGTFGKALGSFGAYAALSAELRELLIARGMLLLRELNISDEDQVKLAGLLGTVRQEGEKGIFKVTMDPEVNPSAYILYGTRVWHMDRLDTPIPPRG